MADAPAAAAPGANPETHKLAAYPLLDWLRFALASIVALGHEGFDFPRPISAGLAVSVFLALSGWLIGGILIATPLRGLPRFFFNRATRIWIPYAFAIALVYGLALAKDGIDLNWVKYLFYDATFTHYNFTTFPRASVEMPLGGTGNHFWSLSIEEQFYLLAPLAMLAVPFGKKLWLWLLFSAVMLALGLRATPIALGVAAAVAHRDYGAWHVTRVGRAIVLAATALAFIALRYASFPQVEALFAVGAILALAVVGARGRWGLLAGAVSYPLYLNHWIGAFVANAVGKLIGGISHGGVVAIAYPSAVLVGLASWALVDRQVMARRNGWYTPARGRALGIAAYAVVTVGLIGGISFRLLGY